MSNEITCSFTTQKFGYLLCVWDIVACRAHGGKGCGLGPCPLGSRMLAGRAARRRPIPVLVPADWRGSAKTVVTVVSTTSGFP